MANRVNVFRQFSLIGLVEEDWNGDALSGHGSENEHYILGTKKLKQQKNSSHFTGYRGS